MIIATFQAWRWVGDMIDLTTFLAKLKRQQILISNLKDACERYVNANQSPDEQKALRDMLGIAERIDCFKIGEIA